MQKKDEEQTLPNVAEKIESELKSGDNILRKRLTAVEIKLDSLVQDQRAYFEALRNEIRQPGSTSSSEASTSGTDRKVALLISLKVHETGKEYVVTATHQKQFGKALAALIPTVNVQQGFFVGDIATLLETKLGLKISLHNVTDLTGLAFSEVGQQGDERHQVYLYRRVINASALHDLHNRLSSGVNEQILLQVVELQEVHRHSCDTKLFSSIYLYQAMLIRGKIKDVGH